ncbi:SbcC/MukB-like Walker B domain-containing protein [Naasia aerilata]|uniref:Nuclease SbcCD subunit C n=1 Tax=Naasia aerilata TaxID=1162966 RepID=A0ABN6XQH0_9MICO|nr:SbcC/MukB-like Walker B domain-containing protein [Naasia aerilata]BDZ47188.1 nuclease SbcCD subunit C [Naasia aerilata]
MLGEILPIKEDQFLQVILLAQNRFQKFLLAKTDERRAVLRTLFGTARFEKLETSLLERRKQLDAEVATTRQTIAMHAATVAEQAELDEAIVPDLDWFLAARDALGERLVVTGATVDVANAEAEAAEIRWRAIQQLLGKQTRLRTAREGLLALEKAAPAIEAERKFIEAAARAELVVPFLDARAAAAKALTKAREAEQAAGESWAPFAAQHNGDVDLPELIDTLTAAVGALDAAVAEEQRLPELRRDVERLTAAAATRAATISARVARIATIPSVLDVLDDKLGAASVLAGTAADRRKELDRAEDALYAARLAEKLENELATASEAERAASKENLAAALAYDDLVNRRHADIASELAAALKPGEACKVCGSVEHPSPAPQVADPVTPATVEKAKATMAARQRDLEAAGARVSDASARLAEARGKAGERSVEEALGQRDAARKAVDAAEQAEHERAMLAAEKAQVRAGLDTESAALEADRTEQRAIAAQVTEATVKRDEATERVRVHRGDHDSVGARAAALRAERDAARELHESREARSQRAEALESAVAALAERLAEHEFDSEDAVTAARLPKAEVEGKRALIRQHEGELAAARSVLADDELADLPAEPVDLAPVQEALVRARQARDTALATHAELKARARVVRAKVVEAEDLLSRSARLLEEYEQVRALAAAVHGEEPNTKRMRLETFVLAAQLEQIIAAANLRLRTMTDGRYTLLLDDERQYRNAEAGLGLTVLDEHTGMPRQTASLSGGEMFLASLSLALGLAEVVSQQAGGIRLDTLFVDEGFGSLDGETLEVAMRALDSLRAGGRTIGLISHVDSMKEQIPAKLAITVMNTGESAIESSYALV